MAKNDCMGRLKLQTAMARGVLDSCDIDRDADFHALTHEQVESLIKWADHYNYRKPADASGSRARYFHALMQRRAWRDK